MNDTTYVNIDIVANLFEQHFNGPLFTNQGDNVLIIVDCTRQICPVVLLHFRTLFDWIGEQRWTEMLFQQFSNTADICGIIGRTISPLNSTASQSSIFFFFLQIYQHFSISHNLPGIWKSKKRFSYLRKLPYMAGSAYNDFLGT